MRDKGSDDFTEGLDPQFPEDAEYMEGYAEAERADALDHELAAEYDAQKDA